MAAKRLVNLSNIINALFVDPNSVKPPPNAGSEIKKSVPAAEPKESKLPAKIPVIEGRYYTEARKFLGVGNDYHVDEAYLQTTAEFIEVLDSAGLEPVWEVDYEKRADFNIEEFERLTGSALGLKNTDIFVNPDNRKAANEPNVMRESPVWVGGKTKWEHVGYRRHTLPAAGKTKDATIRTLFLKFKKEPPTKSVFVTVDEEVVAFELKYKEIASYAVFVDRGKAKMKFIDDRGKDEEAKFVLATREDTPTRLSDKEGKIPKRSVQTIVNEGVCLAYSGSGTTNRIKQGKNWTNDVNVIRPGAQNMLIMLGYMYFIVNRNPPGLLVSVPDGLFFGDSFGPMVKSIRQFDAMHFMYVSPSRYPIGIDKSSLSRLEAFHGKTKVNVLSKFHTNVPRNSNVETPPSRPSSWLMYQPVPDGDAIIRLLYDVIQKPSII